MVDIPGNKTAGLKEKLQSEIDNNKAPSVHYLLFDKDSVIFEYYDGLADIGKNIPVDENTTYHAFSTTKTFTALAILQLQSEGKLNIGESAKKYLPEIPYSSDITIKHLLNHASGIPNPIPLSWIHTMEEHSNFDKQGFIKTLLEENKKTRFKPNEKYAYSNLEYLLLALIIERTSGYSYEDYIDSNVFKKLGTTEQELSFTINPMTQATGYHKKWSFSNLILGFFIQKKTFMGKSGPIWKPFHHFYINGDGYSGLIASPRGMMKYIQALLNPGSTLLGPSEKELLFTENVRNDSKKTGMCLSWFTGEIDGIRYYTHAGGGGGFYCEIRIYPEQGLGSVIMFNRSGMTDQRVLDQYDAFFLD